MRIKNYVPTYDTNWHIWFAWYPVTIGDYTVWLEKVYRREVFWYAGSYYEYEFVYHYPKDSK